MKLLKFSVIMMAFVGQVSARGGGSGSHTSNYGQTSVNYGAGGTSSVTFGGGSSVSYGGSNSFTSSGYQGDTFQGGFGQNDAPRPYNFDYTSADEQGNSHYHREETDGSGAVRGSYGYTDNQGLYRIVEYVADANGYRASIRTNEPGTDGKVNPADVDMTVDPPPFGVQDRYNPYNRGGFGGGVAGVVLGTYTSGLNKTEADNY